MTNTRMTDRARSAFTCRKLLLTYATDFNR